MSQAVVEVQVGLVQDEEIPDVFPAVAPWKRVLNFLLSSASDPLCVDDCADILARVGLVVTGGVLLDCDVDHHASAHGRGRAVERGRVVERIALVPLAGFRSDGMDGHQIVIKIVSIFIHPPSSCAVQRVTIDYGMTNCQKAIVLMMLYEGRITVSIRPKNKMPSSHSAISWHDFPSYPC